MLPDVMTTMTADQLLAEVDARSTALADALDPERRKAALDEILRPFQPGEAYAYVPRKEGIDATTSQFLKDEDQQAAIKLFHAEDFVRKAEPLAVAIEAREKVPPTAEACCRMRAKLVGLNLSDSLSVQMLDELRQMRLVPFAQQASASEQFAAWREAKADDTEALNGTLITVLDRAHLHGFSGPKPTSPEDLKAAQLLRKAIIEAREQRVSESTRALLARFADAKKQVARTKMLHQLAPANPSHPGAVKER